MTHACSWFIRAVKIGNGSLLAFILLSARAKLSAFSFLASAILLWFGFVFTAFEFTFFEVVKNNQTIS